MGQHFARGRSFPGKNEKRLHSHYEYTAARAPDSIDFLGHCYFCDNSTRVRYTLDILYTDTGEYEYDVVRVVLVRCDVPADTRLRVTTCNL